MELVLCDVEYCCYQGRDLLAHLDFEDTTAVKEYLYDKA